MRGVEMSNGKFRPGFGVRIDRDKRAHINLYHAVPKAGGREWADEVVTTCPIASTRSRLVADVFEIHDSLSIDGITLADLIDGKPSAAVVEALRVVGCEARMMEIEASKPRESNGG